MMQIINPKDNKMNITSVPINANSTPVPNQAPRSVTQGETAEKVEEKKSQVLQENPLISSSSTPLLREARQLSKKDFRAIFKRTTNVPMSDYTIGSHGEIFHTTGVAACIAIIAKGFINNKCTKIGLAHFCSADDDILPIFLKSMKKGTKEVSLFIYGGKSWDLLKTKIQTYPKVKIKELLINPWNTFNDYELLSEKLLDQHNFSLSAGIDEEGNIFVADTTQNSGSTGFVQFPGIISQYPDASIK